MNLQWRKRRFVWKYLVLSAIGCLVLAGFLASALHRQPMLALHQATVATKAKGAAASVERPTLRITADHKAGTPLAAVRETQNNSSEVLGVTTEAIKAAIGVYTGPGTIGTHTTFEQWLGRSVPLATDYVDYKGGWQKDFIDSRLWLAEPWGKWVGASEERRMVLGLPMLENENNGQFDQGARGDFDVYFRQLSVDLVSNNLGDSIIRLGYEANCDTIGPWQATNDPAGYKKLFRHIVGVMRAVPKSSFTFDWTVCNGLQEGRPLDSFESFYPGDDVVDIMGMDLYDVKWMEPSATPQQRWSYATERRMGISEWLRFARAHNKPISYPEWGLYKSGDDFAGGGDNPYFITKMSELFKSSYPIYQSYFDLDWGGGVLSDFPKGAAIFKQLFGS